MDKILFLYFLELFFYFIGMAALVIVPVLILISVYLYRKNKKCLGFLSLIMAVPFILSFYIALPAYIASYVMSDNAGEHSRLINFAEKIAIFPADLKSEIVAIPAFKAQLLLRSQRFHSDINDKERNDLINKIVYYYNRACFSKNSDKSSCAELSKVYGLLGKYDEAIYVYEKLYFGIDNDFYADKKLIDYYLLNKDYEGALKALETQKFSEDIKILYKAEVYRLMGKYDSALEILNRYIKTHKYTTNALKYRAYVYHDMGNIKQSKSDYMDIVKTQGAKGIYKNYEYFIKNSDIEWLYNRIRENEGFNPLNEQK